MSVATSARRLQIQGTPGSEGFRLLLDGLEIQNSTCSLALTMGAPGEVTRVELGVQVLVSGVDTEAFVHVPDATRALLVSIGWQPPETPETPEG